MLFVPIFTRNPNGLTISSMDNKQAAWGRYIHILVLLDMDLFLLIDRQNLLCQGYKTRASLREEDRKVVGALQLEHDDFSTSLVPLFVGKLTCSMAWVVFVVVVLLFASFSFSLAPARILDGLDRLLMHVLYHGSKSSQGSSSH